jgi:rRNA maturation protein Nop10
VRRCCRFYTREYTINKLMNKVGVEEVRLPHPPSNSPHDRMILRVGLEGSHGRWKRPRLQTTSG